MELKGNALICIDMAIKDYCIGCYWKYNNECIKPRGEYCPANSIKAERRKAKKKEESK